jgi:hypothetical protein
MKLSTEGAVASDRTDGSDTFLKMFEEKASRIKKAIAGFPDCADGDLARISGTTLSEVRQVRQQKLNAA